MNYRLTRINDGRRWEADDVAFLSFFEDGTFRKKHSKPKVGRSLILPPFNISFTWQTTPITKIIAKKDGYVHFLTKNSEYMLCEKN